MRGYDFLLANEHRSQFAYVSLQAWSRPFDEADPSIPAYAAVATFKESVSEPKAK